MTNKLGSANPNRSKSSVTQKLLKQYIENKDRIKVCKNSLNVLEQKEITGLQAKQSFIKLALLKEMYSISAEELEKLTMTDLFPNIVTTENDYKNIKWKGKEFYLKPAQRKFLKEVMSRWSHTGATRFNYKEIFKSIGSDQQKMAGFFQREVDGFKDFFTSKGNCVYEINIE